MIKKIIIFKIEIVGVGWWTKVVSLSHVSSLILAIKITSFCFFFPNYSTHLFNSCIINNIDINVEIDLVYDISIMKSATT